MKYILFLLSSLTFMACQSTMNRLELQAVEVGTGTYSAFYVPVEEQFLSNEKAEDRATPAFPSAILSDDFQLFPVNFMEKMVAETAYHPVRNQERDAVRSQQITGGKGTGLLAEPVYQVSSVSTSPDGSRLVFSCQERPDAPWTIWVIGTDGTRPRLLTFGKDPCWVNDKTLIFSAPTDGIWTVDQCDADGRNRRALVKQPNHCLQPRVSPDGKMIAFVQAAVTDDSMRNVWVCGINGERVKQLTSYPARDDSPVWSPDNKAVYFRSTRNGVWGIWRLPVTQ